METMASFALDTDIGTDVDDLLALAMVLGSPELSVSEIVTAYGDVALRARIAAKVYAVLGIAAPPIVPGLAETLSGRPVWWPGHEGETISDLADQVFTEGRDAIADLSGTATIAAIAPLANVAAALRQPHSVRQIVLMGGEFQQGIVEHNIRCDVTAAQEVFGSTAEVLAVGLDQTERVRLYADDRDRITAAGPLGALIGAEMRRFWEFADQSHNTPHDPVAILALARHDLYQTARGRITVDDDGLTMFSADEAGPHRIVTDLDVDGVKDEIVRRILTAAAAPADAA